jgi:hypothetical protein
MPNSGRLGVAAYNRAKAAIEGLDLSNLPISPIDALKDRIRKAGYTVGEITGRGSIVDYSEPEARLRSRPGSELSIRGRREAINGYNGGKSTRWLSTRRVPPAFRCTRASASRTSASAR